MPAFSMLKRATGRDGSGVHGGPCAKRNGAVTGGGLGAMLGVILAALVPGLEDKPEAAVAMGGVLATLFSGLGAFFAKPNGAVS